MVDSDLARDALLLGAGIAALAVRDVRCTARSAHRAIFGRVAHVVVKSCCWSRVFCQPFDLGACVGVGIVVRVGVGIFAIRPPVCGIVFVPSCDEAGRMLLSILILFPPGVLA